MSSALKRALALASTLAQMHRHIAPTQHDRYSYTCAAEKLGLEALGSGYFSTAFAEDDSPYVIKVCFANDAAITYLAWCRANPTMKHLPRVHYLQRFKSGCYIAVLDRLHVMEADYDYTGDRRYGEDFVEARSVLECDEEPTTSVGHTALAIREFFKGVASHDLHGENAMRDEYGELVITDPLSHIQSKDLKTGIERAYGIKEAA